MNEHITLYDILDAEKAIQDIGESEGEFTHALAVQKEEKVTNTIKYLRNIETIAKQAKEEAKRLKELSEKYEKQAERVKEWVKYSMLAHDITRIETSLGKLGIRRSEQTIIDDIEKIPITYITTKQVTTVDKIAIKEALKNGETIEGAHIEEVKSLSIK